MIIDKTFSLYKIDTIKSFPYISYKKTLLNDFQYTSCVQQITQLIKYIFNKIDFDKLFIYIFLIRRH